VVVAGALVAGIVGVALARTRDRELPRYIGAAACARCHVAETVGWKLSQHFAAMQPATPATVLGRFDSTAATFGGIMTTFLRRGTDYVVNTEGEDGKPHDYTIKYTFGVAPLQQYLVELSHGRLQPLPTAWDTRPASHGGQRWFSLDPGPWVAHTDEFHWTSRQRNWNYMCADCHSTGVRKRYDASSDQFRTTWAELNVSCEACHGPGSAHARWARYPSWTRSLLWKNDGLPAQLTERRGVDWGITNDGRPIRSVPRTSDREIQTCAQCHSRRVQIADGYAAGDRYLDHYVPSLLVSGLYYADGQQHDEVYNYGSFLESRMYHAGVTCSDCHDPHSARPRAPGNRLCTRCHVAAKYDTTAHTFHARGGAGAACVSCHMPATTYMQIDPRADHSIRVPRPDLSVTLGVPNACSSCHRDRDARWAANQVRYWYGHDASGFQRFAASFAADERGAAFAGDSLAAVARDATEPAIVRASALARLRDRPSAAAFGAAQLSARDTNALVRRAALSVLESVPPAQRMALAIPLLADSVRAVRIEAAWVLAPAASTLTGADSARFAAAGQDFISSQRYNADRAENRLTLGTYFAELGRFDEASTELRAAISLSPGLGEAYANLADVQRAQHHDTDAEATLRRGLVAAPNDPRLHYALGLALARAGRVADAVQSLAVAASLAPNDATIGFTYAVALRDARRDADARRVTRQLASRFPNDARIQALLRDLK